MTPPWYRLLAMLADGRRVGGPVLADRLGLSRAAVWKQIERLRAMGVPLVAERGRGYGLAWPVELLDGELLSRAVQGLEVEVHPELDSTNRELSARPPHRRHACALIAEYQSGGRGRRNRRWLSPPAAGLYLSLGWRFECGMMRLGALSLVAGLAAADAVRAACGLDIRLKWPNDLLHAGRKLGGCLVEIGGTADGPCHAVVGIGINVRMPDAIDPGQPWTDLWQAAGFAGRNRLAAALLETLPEALGRLERQGFEAFQPAWTKRDALADRPLRVILPDGESRRGIGRGISARGGLYVEHGDTIEEMVMGEVSIRAA